MAYRTADFPFWLRLIVVVTLCLLAINIFFFAGPLAVLLPAFSAFTPKDILAGLGTILGTFFGAWLAFRFANIKAKREKIDENVAAGNRALFTLTFMYNGVRQHQKEIVEPYRGKRDSWLNLHVGSPLNEERSFSMKDLSFLMEADPETYQSLFLEEERYRLVVYLVEDHRKIILEHAWPRLEGAGLEIGDGDFETEIKKILGPSIVKRLTVTTDGIIRNIDENEKSHRDAFVRLRAALKKIYPDRKFIQFEFDAPSTSGPSRKREMLERKA
jgi:hypothetical protein